MSLRHWLQAFVTAGALTWSIPLVRPASLHAQPPMPPVPPSAATDPATGSSTAPRLPDVNVVAPEPQPANVAPTPAPQMPLGAEDNVLTGNLFTAPPTVGYRAGASTTGSILPIPDLRFPGTVNTITQELRQDQQALRISDIIRDIGGAVQTNNDRLRPDSFLLRGLEMTSYNFRKNGFQDPTYTPRDFANVERIDVLKGPASVVYGGAQPAGTLNIVTKRAVQDRFAFGSMTFGSYGLQRYAADVNSTGVNSNMLYRVNAAFEDRDTFRNFSDNSRVFVAPTFTRLISPDTAITWEGEYLHDRRIPDSGLIAVNGDTRAFPADKFFGNNLTDFQEFHDYRSTLFLTHRFNDDWQFYFGGTTLFYDAPSRITVPTGIGVPPGGFYPGGFTARTQSTASAFSEQNHALITNLAGVFDTGPFTHNTVTGVELDWQVVNHDQFDTGASAALVIDPANPDPFPAPLPPTVFTFNNPGFRQKRYGFYTSDYVEVTERLSLMGGLRWDTIHQAYNRQLIAGGFTFFNASTDDTFERLSPRGGVIYELVPGAMSVYGVYTQSFNSPAGGNFGFTPGPIQPELGEIWESGVKTNIFEDLTLSVAGFYIDRSNVTTVLPGFIMTQADRQRSQGVEVNLVGNWTDRLSTVSNYTYSDVVQTSATGAISGRVRGVPFNLFNTWTRYNLIQERDRTVGVALGHVFVGDRRGDYGSPLVLPSYHRWDLGFYGTLRRWELSTYVENIFSTRYETGSLDQYQVYPGAPANFRTQLSVRF